MRFAHQRIRYHFRRPKKNTIERSHISLEDVKHPAPIALPNLFILGAGRCGTTSLYSVLDNFADIYMSEEKEPSFFSSYFQVVANPIDYFRLFGPGQTHRFRGEASHLYLSNPESAGLINAAIPDPKFIVILRRPQARAFSLYQFMKHRGYEPIRDFHKALLAEDERFLSDSFFKNCPGYFYNFMYVRSSMFDEQIARYLALYDRDRFYFTSLAELSHRPRKVMEDLGDFLNIDVPNVFEFRRRNQTRINDPIPRDAEPWLHDAFDGLQDRVEKLIGHRLDWSV